MAFRNQRDVEAARAEEKKRLEQEAELKRLTDWRFNQSAQNRERLEDIARGEAIDRKAEANKTDFTLPESALLNKIDNIVLPT